MFRRVRPFHLPSVLWQFATSESECGMGDLEGNQPPMSLKPVVEHAIYQYPWDSIISPSSVPLITLDRAFQSARRTKEPFGISF